MSSVKMTVCRGRAVLVVLVCALAAGVAASPVSAGGARTTALTGWQTFGHGFVAGRGELGLPNVFLQSTTRANPQRIRAVIQGARGRSVEVAWALFCWREPSFANRSADGNFARRMPVDLNLSTRVGGVSSWRHCTLYMSAFRKERGELRVRLQARFRR